MPLDPPVTTARRPWNSSVRSRKLDDISVTPCVVVILLSAVWQGYKAR
jgi:hypothetical protein